jgi:hypothetical protein
VAARHRRVNLDVEATAHHTAGIARPSAPLSCQRLAGERRVREESDLGEIGGLLRIEIERVEGQPDGASPGQHRPRHPWSTRAVREPRVIAASLRMLDDTIIAEIGEAGRPERAKNQRAANPR